MFHSGANGLMRRLSSIVAVFLLLPAAVQVATHTPGEH